jgi:hypothetical protein
LNFNTPKSGCIKTRLPSWRHNSTILTSCSCTERPFNINLLKHSVCVNETVAGSQLVFPQHRPDKREPVYVWVLSPLLRCIYHHHVINSNDAHTNISLSRRGDKTKVPLSASSSSVCAKFTCARHTFCQRAIIICVRKHTFCASSGCKLGAPHNTTASWGYFGAENVQVN